MNKRRRDLAHQIDCALQPSHNALVAIAQLTEPRQQQYAEDFGIVERFALADLLLVIHRDLDRQIHLLKKTLGSTV
jgi:hypothetical protein